MVWSSSTGPRRCQLPLVSANLVRGTDLGDNPLEDDTYLEPYRIFEKELTDGSGATYTIRIGVIGFLPHRSSPGTPPI